MKCSKCNLAMKETEKSITNNELKDDKYKEYLKILYHCEYDDVWISIEVPNKFTN